MPDLRAIPTATIPIPSHALAQENEAEYNEFASLSSQLVKQMWDRSHAAEAALLAKATEYQMALEEVETALADIRERRGDIKEMMAGWVGAEQNAHKVLLKGVT